MNFSGVEFCTVHRLLCAYCRLLAREFHMPFAFRDPAGVHAPEVFECFAELKLVHAEGQVFNNNGTARGSTAHLLLLDLFSSLDNQRSVVLALNTLIRLALLLWREIFSASLFQKLVGVPGVVATSAASASNPVLRSFRV